MVFGAIPNSGIKKKKSAAMVTLTVCPAKSVTDSARLAKIIERLSYRPATINTPTHTTNRKEKADKGEVNRTHEGALKVRKKREAHSAKIKAHPSPTNKTSGRARKAVVICRLIYNTTNIIILKLHAGYSQKNTLRHNEVQLGRRPALCV